MHLRELLDDQVRIEIEQHAQLLWSSADYENDFFWVGVPVCDLDLRGFETQRRREHLADCFVCFAVFRGRADADLETITKNPSDRIS